MKGSQPHRPRPGELAARLAEALTQRADEVRPSPPPAFSWQRTPADAIGTGPARADRGPRSHRRFPKLALIAVAAATLVVLGGFLVNTGRDTAPATGPDTREVAYLAPGFGTPMKAGQFFYRPCRIGCPGRRPVPGLLPGAGGATAQVPGIVITHHTKNLSGTVGTSYEMDAPTGNVAGPLIFDANGNYIGRPDSGFR